MDVNSRMFQFVADAADRNRQSYLKNFWTTLGSLVVAIGWFLTSKTAKVYISSKPEVSEWVVAIVAGLLISHIVVLVYTFWNSQKLYSILQKFNFEILEKNKDEILSSYAVLWYWLPVNIGINGSLFGFLIYQILSLGNTATC